MSMGEAKDQKKRADDDLTRPIEGSLPHAVEQLTLAWNALGRAYKETFTDALKWLRNKGRKP